MYYIAKTDLKITGQDKRIRFILIESDETLEQNTVNDGKFKFFPIKNSIDDIYNIIFIRSKRDGDFSILSFMQNSEQIASKCKEIKFPSLVYRNLDAIVDIKEGLSALNPVW